MFYFLKKRVVKKLAKKVNEIITELEGLYLNEGGGIALMIFMSCLMILVRRSIILKRW
ncbi:hypothetical protein AT01_3706 [Yersinia aldovae 670-83]|nr:hypothetical protein AT01_3706 [Yersinia aldovae 670-83]